MTRTDLWRSASAAVAIAWCAGCAHVAVPAPTTEPAADRRPAVPLSLEGADTRLRIRLPRSDQNVEPGQFQKDEVCYIEAGAFRIDCFTDGSSLNLGPTDSTALLSDNPMWEVQPAGGDRVAIQYMRLYGVLFLVGGSLERLPQTLSDYIASPGPHQEQALALAELLVGGKPVELKGVARGGTFTVTFELTDAGQDKLIDALDEVGQPTTGLQLARAAGR